jgi:hypothetical protein
VLQPWIVNYLVLHSWAIAAFSRRNPDATKPGSGFRPGTLYSRVYRAHHAMCRRSIFVSQKRFRSPELQLRGTREPGRCNRRVEWCSRIIPPAHPSPRAARPRWRSAPRGTR